MLAALSLKQEPRTRKARIVRTGDGLRAQGARCRTAGEGEREREKEKEGSDAREEQQKAKQHCMRAKSV